MCSAPSSWAKFAPVWASPFSASPFSEGVTSSLIQFVRVFGGWCVSLIGRSMILFQLDVILDCDFDDNDRRHYLMSPPLVFYYVEVLGVLGKDACIICMHLLHTLYIGCLLTFPKQGSYTLAAGFMAMVIMVVPVVVWGQEPTCTTGAAVASVFRGLALASDATLLQSILNALPAPATLSLSVGTAVRVATRLAGAALWASSLMLLGVFIVPVLGVVAALADLARVAHLVLPAPLPALTTYTLAVAAGGVAVHGVVTMASTAMSLVGVARRAPSVIPRLLTARARASLLFLVPHWVGHWAGTPVWASTLVALALWSGRCTIACISANRMRRRAACVLVVGVWWLVSLGLRGDLPPFALVRILVLATYAAGERFRSQPMVSAVRAYIREHTVLTDVTTVLLLWAGILPLWCVVRILYLFGEASIVVPARIGVLVAAFQVWSIAVEPLRCLSRSALVEATSCADGGVSGGFGAPRLHSDCGGQGESGALCPKK